MSSTVSAADDGNLPPDIARIKQSGVLRVALTREDYPPFYYQKQDQLKGLDIELAQDIARRLGVKLEFRRLARSWDEVVQVVVAGEADVAISALSRTLPRAQEVVFTQPYVILAQALLVNRLKLASLGGEQAPLKRLDSAGVRIGTLSESSYLDFAHTAFPAVQVTSYPHWDGAIKALLAGKVHAVMFDPLLCKRSLLVKPQRALTVQLLVTQRPDPIAMAVNWRDHDLLQWLNVYIDTVRGNGYLQQLQDEYIGTEVRHATD